jgi:YD repeat-containing protein
VCPNQAADPVETATGNFWETFTDVAVPGRGVPLAFSRTYNSDAASTDGALGFGWTFNYAMSLSVAPDLSWVTVHEENGAEVTFTLAGAIYTAPPRVIASLVHNGDGTWTFTRRARQIFDFDVAGRLTGLRDLNGYSATLGYSGNQLSTVTDPAGRTLTLGWTAGRISSVTDTANPPRSVTFQYLDGVGNLTDVVDVGGGHWTFGYDASHRMTTMRTPKYFGDTTTTPTPVTTNHYDASGRVDWQTDALGRQTSFDYTSIPGATKVTDPKGNVRVDTFTDGLLVARTLGYGTPQVATWSYAHDPATLGVIAVTDPNGGLWATSYDNAGNITVRQDPLGRTISATYNAFNQPLTGTDPAGVTTTLVYDPAGNLLSESTPMVGSNPPVAKTTTFTYGDASHPGDVTAVTDPDTKSWPQSYDGYGNLATVTDPVGDTTRYCTDIAGHRTRVIAPKGTAAGVTCATGSPTYSTVVQPNAFGAPLTVTDALGHTTTFTYDANGNRDTVLDADGHLTTSTYNPAGELTQVSRADSPATMLRYDYFPDGRLQRVLDGANQPTTYGYDPLGRVTSVTDPLGRTTGYGYDPAGNRTQKLDPGGSCTGAVSGCTTSRYDAARQLVGVDYSDPATPDVAFVAYDANGRRTEMVEGAGVTGVSRWTWDSLGRMTSSTDGAGQTVGYGYNLRGLVTSIVYPGTTGTVTRTYDDAGRLRTVLDWLNNETVFNHDADSFLTSQVYPNGTTATYSPDAADRVMGESRPHGRAGEHVGVFRLRPFRHRHGHLGDLHRGAGRQPRVWLHAAPAAQDRQRRRLRLRPGGQSHRPAWRRPDLRRRQPARPSRRPGHVGGRHRRGEQHGHLGDGDPARGDRGRRPDPPGCHPPQQQDGDHPGGLRPGGHLQGGHDQQDRPVPPGCDWPRERDRGLRPEVRQDGHGGRLPWRRCRRPLR